MPYCRCSAIRLSGGGRWRCFRALTRSWRSEAWPRANAQPRSFSILPPRSLTPPHPMGALLSQDRAGELGLFASRDWRVVAPRCAGIELTRPTDFLIRVFDHFFPLRDPAHRTGHRKQDGEHGGREAHRLERNARIEVDVWIKLLLDEVVIVQCNPLKLHCYVEQRVVLDAELVENFVAGLLHDFGARVVVLIDAMAKTHQSERIVLVLGSADIFRD